MQEPSIFTKIYNGDIPGEIIYKDDQCFVLLSIQPFSPGHALVIPIQQTDHIWDVDETVYHHLFDVAKKIAKAIEATYAYARVEMLVEGYEMPHAHIHVFGGDQSITHLQQSPPTASHEALKVEADKLRACL